MTLRCCDHQAIFSEHVSTGQLQLVRVRKKPLLNAIHNKTKRCKSNSKYLTRVNGDMNYLHKVREYNQRLLEALQVDTRQADSKNRLQHRMFCEPIIPDTDIYQCAISILSWNIINLEKKMNKKNKKYSTERHSWI